MALITATISSTPYAQPDDYTPINIDYGVYFSLTSQSTGQPNFQYTMVPYTYDRLTGATTSILFGKYEITPRPIDGLFSPWQIIKTQISNYYTFSSTASGIQTIVDDRAIVLSGNQYGVQYDPLATFSSTFMTVYGGNNLLSLDFFPNMHNMQVGDKIFIDKDNPQYNSYYNGEAEVLLVLDLMNIVTNIEYGQDISNESGAITSLYRVVNSTKKYYGFNGTRQYNQLGTNFGASYAVGYSGKTASFLTTYDYNKWKSIFDNQYETTAFMLSPTASVNSWKLTTYDYKLNSINSYTASLGVTKSYVYFVMGCGTNNINGINMNGATVSLNNVSYYQIDLLRTNTQSLAKIRRQIICNQSPYQNVRIMFMNKLGGYDYYNFNYDSQKSAEISRNEFLSQLNYNYNIGDRGYSVYTTYVNEKYQVNTDMISEYDYQYLCDNLTEGSNAYVIDENTMDRYPIVILDTSYIVKTVLRESVFNFVLTFKYAFNKNIQSI